MNKTDKLITLYANFILKQRWAVFFIGLIITALFGYGISKLSISTDYRDFFNDDNPRLIALKEIEQTYTKGDTILFVFAAPEGETVFSKKMLELQLEFTERAWELPHSRRVDSLTNYQRSQADGDELIVGDLIEDLPNLSEKDIEEIKTYALSEPILYQRLIVDDLKNVGLTVTFELPGQSNTETPEIVAAARKLVSEFKQKYPNVNFHMTGGIMISNTFSEAAESDAASFIPAMYFVILFTVWLMTRSVSGMVGTFTVVTMCTAIALGIAGYLGIELNAPSMVTPILIMTLAIADCIHILVSILQNMHHGMQKNRAIVESIRINFMPILITSITTALGFMTLNFAKSPPLQDLGNITAMGVIAAWILSISWFVAFLAMLPLKAKKARIKLESSMNHLANFVIRERRLLLIIIGCTTIVLLAFIPRNDGNDDFVRYFSESNPFRADTDYINDNLTGMYQLVFSLDSGEEYGIADPKYLKKLEHFTQWIEQQPATRHTYSVVNIFKQINQNMNSGDPNFYRIPEQRDLASQFLLVYEMQLPFGLDVTDMMNQDRSASRFLVTLDSHLDAVATRALAEDAKQWMDENYPNLAGYPVSPNILFSYISQRNINSMVMGMLVALVGISLILILALRSVKIGLLSLIPNLIPIGIAFGIWGILVGEVNFTMAIVMGMTLGIVVDDTVHLLSKYLRAKREHNFSSEDAIHYAFKTVGGALFTMSIVLIAGFVILTQSDFLANSAMAKLTVIAIISALVTDFLLLPPLLLLKKNQKKK